MQKLFSWTPFGNSSKTDQSPESQAKTGRRTNKTMNFHTVTFSQGAGFRAPPKEDRILAIEDLYDYVHSYHGTYNTGLFGDQNPPPAPSATFLVPCVGSDEMTPYDPNGTFCVTTEEGEAEAGFPRSDTATSFRSVDDAGAVVDKFKLFAVFDGHCGKIAASYLQYRFPFELCGSELFKQGKYEQALKFTYAIMHETLKQCSKYGPERPYCDYASGATASVVLVTPTMTYFAFLGDSPIVVWKHDEPKPDILFNEHDADNPVVHRNLLNSNVFLVLVRERLMSIVYYLVTQPIVKETLFNIPRESNDVSDPSASSFKENQGLGQEQQQQDDDKATKELIAQTMSRRSESQPRPLNETIENTDVDDDDPGLPFVSPGIGGDPKFEPSSPVDGSHHFLSSDLDDEENDVPLANKDLQTFKDSRLDDDADKVIVRPGVEILLEKSSKSLPRPSRPSKQDLANVSEEGGNEPLSASPVASSPISSSADSSNLGTSPTQFQLEGETLEYDDIRVGLSALNVFGSIGDTSYDPDVFNAFLGEVVAFKQSRFEKYEELKQEKHYMEMANMTVMSSSSGVIPFTSRSVASPPSPQPGYNADGTINEDVEFDPLEFSYDEFRDFVASRPTWDFLKKHMYLMKEEQKCSRVLLAAIRYLDSSHHLAQPGLLRQPEIKKIPNKDLKMFLVTSDGVIRFYDKFKDQFQSMIMSYEHQPERLANKLKDYMKWLGDDRSIIICRFGSIPKKAQVSKAKLASSRKLYQQLRNKRLSVTLPPTPFPVGG